MSGHSKWATTRRQKEAADKKRGATFTKLARVITVAAREGGSDSNTNFKLRLAIEKAKQGNMPKDNIERAIKRGTGELTGETIEEVTYEAIGPENIALIIKCLTDNKNRTMADLKNILTKNDGKLASNNSVSWMFDQKAVITIENYPEKLSSLDSFQLELIDQGAEDFETANNTLIIYVQINNLQKIKEVIESQNIKIDSAEIEFVPKKENLVDPSPEALVKGEKLIDALEENDDIEKVFTNIK